MDNNFLNKYFAAKEKAEETVAILQGKIREWGNEVNDNGYLDKLRRSWAAYHGAYFDGNNSHTISFAGEQGELVQLPVNHFRNIGMHLLNLTTSTRPAINTRAINTDYKSQTQTVLANGLLEYYMREKRLEDYLRIAAEQAIVLGEGYVRIEWDAMAGEPVDFNEETLTEIYEGDLKFSNVSSFDVVRDSYREDNDHDWLIVRTFKNRFDLAAKYPELGDKLMDIKSKDKMIRGFRQVSVEDTELIPVYEFFHKRSEALPDGRYIIFCDTETIMYDGPLPYRMIPIFKISPATIMGTPYGYTSLFDLLPIQENINSLYSVIATNQNAFGVQNIMVPKNSGITISNLGGGLNIIEYNPQAGIPQPLNLVQTPAEIFNTIRMLIQDMETLSGVNSVTRGQPEASLRSGAALALVHAQAINFSSGLQASYIRLIEDVGTAVIKILQDFASVPRVAAIAGKSNTTNMEEFTGDDLSMINRVIVEVSNPVSKSTAGRLEIATQLLQQQMIKNTDQYFTVLNTGRLDTLFEGDQANLLNIRKENEQMMDGNEVIVMPLDPHRTHILEHRALLADPDFRKNPELVALVMDHINEHINALRSVDKDLLALAGEQPLEAPQEAMANPNVPMPQGQESLENAGPINEEMGQEQPSVPVEAEMPQMPRAAGNPELPLTPEENLG